MLTQSPVVASCEMPGIVNLVHICRQQSLDDRAGRQGAPGFIPSCLPAAAWRRAAGLGGRIQMATMNIVISSGPRY